MTDLQTQSAGRNTGAKWFNSPVTFHEGSLIEIRDHIPTFERRGLALTQPDNVHSRMNERLDTIVRMPFGEDKSFIPVGVVSKNYNLVPHTDVLDIATKALEMAKIKPTDVQAELEITEYGERMAPCQTNTLSIQEMAILWLSVLSSSTPWTEAPGFGH